jgi:hypothetical protein
VCRISQLRRRSSAPQFGLKNIDVDAQRETALTLRATVPRRRNDDEPTFLLKLLSSLPGSVSNTESRNIAFCSGRRLLTYTNLPTLNQQPCRHKHSTHNNHKNGADISWSHERRCASDRTVPAHQTAHYPISPLYITHGESLSHTGRIAAR